LENIVDVFSYEGRTMVVYAMPNGGLRAFYCSLHGTGGKESGRFYPFDGVASPPWIIKSQYYRDEDGTQMRTNDPRFGYGTGVLSDVLQEASRTIGGLDLPEKIDNLTSPATVNRRLMRHGVVLSGQAAKD